jgi:two-component system sensor histidine kinase BarA
VIAVTAHALAEEREKVISAGMDDYISKPVSQKVLADMLQRWWPKRQGVASDAPNGVAPVAALEEPREADSPLDPSVRRSETVVRLFLRTVPAYIEAVERAILANDPSEVKRAAHELKGGCLAVGVPHMASVSAQLEQNPANRAELCAELSREFQRVRSRMAPSDSLGHPDP